MSRHAKACQNGVGFFDCSKEMVLTLLDIFVDNASNFSSLFHRILSMTLDQSIALPVRTNLLGFAIDAFQSLDSALVRKECAPLVSISIWHNLAGESSRESFFENHSQLRKAWRASKKRYDAADDLTQARLRFERSWLFSMSLEFLSLLQEDNEASLCKACYPKLLTTLIGRYSVL